VEKIESDGSISLYKQSKGQLHNINQISCIPFNSAILLATYPKKKILKYLAAELLIIKSFVRVILKNNLHVQNRVSVEKLMVWQSIVYN
jgi:hypothetical protein